MHRFAVHVAFVLIAVLATVQSAAAQSARDHFEKGAELYEAGNCRAAIEAFEKSLALVDNAATHINLGVCHEDLGHLVAARRHYRAAERMAEANGDARIAKDAADKARALEARKLARVIVRAARRDAVDLIIALDGDRVALDELGKYIYVAPGAHRVGARADGCSPYETTVQLGKGEEAMVDIPALACAVESVVRGRGKGRRITGYAGVGVGAAALLGSVGMGVLSNGVRNEAFASGACDRDALTCTQDGQAMMTQAHERARYATMLAGAGVVLVGAGVALWLSAPRESRATRALTPMVSRDRAGLALSGRF